MKNLFPGFYCLTDVEFERLWKDGLFILDANVLLNLYRYPEKAREDLLKALQKIQNRLWLPFQAALEYQRNRQSVMAEQRSRFSDVRRILENAQQEIENELQQLQLKKRHSNINPDTFTKKLTELVNAFTSELDALEISHTGNIQRDELRDRIEKLFENRLGPPPVDQKALDLAYKDGELRFEKNVPPGYLDRKKEKEKQGDDFTYGGLSYKRKFGDLLVWKQIIEHAKASKLKDVIFVTDDDKDDWWWCVESNGRKKIGPRPELVEEIAREAGVERFHMYSSEQFLEFADAKLKVKVDKDSIAQVTKSKEEARNVNFRASNVVQRAHQINKAVYRWLSAQYPSDRILENETGFPDFIIELDSAVRLGVEIIQVRGLFGLMNDRVEKVFRGHYEISTGRLNRCLFLFIFVDDIAKERTIRRIRSKLKELPPGIEIRIGTIRNHDERTLEIESSSLFL